MLKAKQEAGAEFAVTEMVLRATDYFCAGRARRGTGRGHADHPGHHADPEPRLDEPHGRALRAGDARRDAGAHRAARRHAGAAPRRGHPDLDRALRGAARGRRAGAALLHPELLQGDPRDLRRPGRSRSDRGASSLRCATWSERRRTRTVPSPAGQHRRRPGPAVVRVAAVARAAGVAEAFASGSACRHADRRGRPAPPEEERIASTGIDVWPWRDNQGRAAGFEARHSLAIGCPDLDAAGALLDELAGDGRRRARRRGRGPRGLRGTAEAGDQAVEAAFADARDRAEQLPPAAGWDSAPCRRSSRAMPTRGPSPMPKMALARASRQMASSRARCRSPPPSRWCGSSPTDVGPRWADQLRRPGPR